MWINRQEFDALCRRVEVLEKHNRTIQVPIESAPTSSVFAAGGSFYDWHTPVDVPTVVATLAERAGHRWARGQQGKLISKGKQAKP